MSPTGLRTFLNKLEKNPANKSKQTDRQRGRLSRPGPDICQCCLSLSKFYLLSDRSRDRSESPRRSLPFVRSRNRITAERADELARRLHRVFGDRVLLVLDSICRQKSGRFRYRCSLVAVTNPAERLRPPRLLPLDCLLSCRVFILFWFFCLFFNETNPPLLPKKQTKKSQNKQQKKETY